MNYCCLIYDSSGQILAERASAAWVQPDDFNVYGVINIIEPISKTSSSFICSLEFGLHRADCSFYRDHFCVFISSVIDDANGLIMSSLCAIHCEELPPEIPVAAVNAVIAKFLADAAECELIEIITNGNTRVLSHGKTMRSTPDFISAWCDTMNFIAGADDSFSHDDILVDDFLFGMHIVCFLKSPTQKPLVSSKITTFQSDLMESFTRRTPVLPSTAKTKSGRRNPRIPV